MTNDKLPKRRNRNPHGSSRLNDEQLAVLEWLAPGFRDEYEATHDADGKVLPEARIPGLRPLEESGEHKRGPGCK